MKNPNSSIAGYAARCIAGLSFSVAATMTAQAAQWSDTEIQFLHGSGFNDNGTFGGPKFSKDIITLQHASGYSLGRNFFFVDFVKSDSKDGNYGEIYGEYYHTLSLTKLQGTDWSKNFVKDVGLTAGINYGAKNSAFGANPRVLLVGPTFDLNIPAAAFFNVDVLAYADRGIYSGFGGGALCGGHKTTWQITPAWNFPFSVGPAKFTFEGFMDVIGKHGSCERQVLTQPQLRWDVGNHFGRPGAVFLGLEYQYWRNKFGAKQSESFPQLLLGVKF